MIDHPPPNSPPFPPQIILDPSGLYDCAAGFQAIATERQWVEHLPTARGRWWVQGERLCAWTRVWLQAHHREAWIVTEQRSPRLEAQQIAAPLELPIHWTDADCLAMVNTLNRYELADPNVAIAHYLAHLSNSDLTIWLAPPSRENLAAWLTVAMPPDGQFLQQVWQQQRPASPYFSHYQTEHKTHFLKQWLGIADAPPLPHLGPYPGPMPAPLKPDFDHYWRSKLIETQGGAIDTIHPDTQPHLAAIATLAAELFSDYPAWCTPARQGKLKPYLTPQQRQDLSDRTPPAIPHPLHSEASPQDALTWATQQYLPFRRWETLYSQEKESEAIAQSFVTWLLQHYPDLANEPVTTSLLNYNITEHIQTHIKKSPVLWVVVDGLGWLDHQHLVELLTQENTLNLETDIQPRFSILPTTTQYAKWSLYSGLLPEHESWSNDLNTAFKTLGLGERYTDNSLAKLDQDIEQKTHQLYCWDTIILDKLYHDQRDWNYCYHTERKFKLKEISVRILDLLKKAPNSDQFKVVITSDHGQLFGASPQLSVPPSDLEWHGRVAYGILEQDQLISLDAQLYHLPKSMSVIRSAATANTFNRASHDQIIGSHGGLFPEEVVLGFSVLSPVVNYQPPVATVSGTGKAGNSGKLELRIFNPNATSMYDLRLEIDTLFPPEQPKHINGSVAGRQDKFIPISLAKFPELASGAEDFQLQLKGKLLFLDANQNEQSVTLSPSSSLTIQQDYISGISGAILDEFLSE